jgi:hypothetical protein
MWHIHLVKETKHQIKTMKITHAALRQKIAESKGNLFCQVLSLTDAKALKRNNPFGTILKKAAASVSVGTDYEKAVNTVAAKEGNENAGSFVAESIWNGKGEHVVPNKIIRHIDTGREYLYCQTSDKQIDAFPPHVEYQTVSGEKLSREDVAPFLPVKAASAKQAAFGNENERNVRMIAFDNILAIKMNGELFEVEG